MDTADSTSYTAHPRPSFGEHPRQRTTNPPPEEGHQNQTNPSQKHYRPRQCRICFEVVQPTLRPPVENVPTFLQPGPSVVYEDEEGRLIRPCECKGSSKYVHENCLAMWRKRDPDNPRNFYHCPTCGFHYKLSRLGWAGLFASVATRSALTLSILVFTAFMLGFIADPIIRIALDPMAAVAEQFVEGSEEFFPESHEAVSWYEHFLNGFASIGLVSFLKVFLSNPLNWLNRWGPGGHRAQRGTSGRDRISSYTWVFVLFGIVMFLAGIWKVVQKWSTHILRQVEQKVMDVHGEEDEDEDDDDATPGVF